MNTETQKSIKQKLTQTKEFVWEVIKVVAISLVIIIPIRYFIIQPFYVRGSSMEPNFFDYEYLIIDEINYRFNEPERGQVVVLHDPRHTSEFFIKRIIGLPGDTVSMRNGKVYVNDQKLDESWYLAEDVYTDYAPNQDEFIVPDNQYFVMGDNRQASYDSRRFGPVDRSEFIGRVWIRAWPVDRFTTF